MLSFLYSPTLTSIHDYWKNHSMTRWTFVGKVMPLFFVCWFGFPFLFYLFLLYNIVLVLQNIDMNPLWMYMCSPSWAPVPPPSPSNPSGLSQCTNSKHPVSYIEPELDIHFTYNLHVSMPFSHIIPPSPSTTESRRLLYISVSLLLSHIQAYHYYLSKFHIFALVYCIGVFLSVLLHSVQ